ncbi:MAG: phosphoglycerate mutase [Magnetovibrio sp.]|nr:phosphoglycerate mutase [Magnetovibrio sp.]
MTTHWWWVRHAPVINVDGILYGSSEIECDITNTSAFKALADVLPNNALCLTSGLGRTKKTFNEICNNGLQTEKTFTENDLNEQSFGDWQGYSWAEMESMSPEKYHRFWEDPVRQRPPGGESFTDQVERVGKLLKYYTQKYEGKNIIAVCHGGTIRAALTFSLNLSPESGMAFKIDTLSLTKTEYIKGGILRGKGSAWRVTGVNLPVADESN